MSYTCLGCGKVMETMELYCPHCGSLTEPTPQPKRVCPLCNTAYTDGSQFCMNDGSLFTTHTTKPGCVVCGKQYDAQTKFCPEDGGIVLQVDGSTTDTIFSQLTSFPKAHLLPRFLACVIDGFVIMLLALPAILFFIKGIDVAFSSSGRNSDRLLLAALICCIFPFAYSLVKDGLWSGQSVGKKCCRLMVVQIKTGLPSRLSESCIRNFISMLMSIIPFVGWLIDPVMILATNDGRKPGDKVAKTQVIDFDIYYKKQ